jgi:hypothetical protein
MNHHDRRKAKAKARKDPTGYLHRMPALTGRMRGPGVTHVMVQHDDDCAIFRSGECTCCPDMQLRVDGSDVVEIVGLDGSVTGTMRRS